MPVENEKKEEKVEDNCIGIYCITSNAHDRVEAPLSNVLSLQK